MVVPPFKVYWTSKDDLTTPDQRAFYRSLGRAFAAGKKLEVDGQISYLFALLREEDAKGRFGASLAKMVVLYRHEERFMFYAVQDLIYLQASKGNWALVSTLILLYRRHVSPALQLDEDLRTGLGPMPATLTLFDGPGGRSTPESLRSAWLGHVAGALVRRRDIEDEFLQFRDRELQGGLLREGGPIRQATLYGGAGDSFAYDPIVKPILEDARATIMKQKLRPNW